MAGYRTSDPEGAAARLKRRFQGVTRRMQWRRRAVQAHWLLTVSAEAAAGGFTCMALLQIIGS